QDRGRRSRPLRGASGRRDARTARRQGSRRRPGAARPRGSSTGGARRERSSARAAVCGGPPHAPTPRSQVRHLECALRFMTTAFEKPHFEIPRLRTLARHAVPHVIEGTIVPLALFLLTLHFLGVWGAVVTGV